MSPYPQWKTQSKQALSSVGIATPDDEKWWRRVYKECTCVASFNSTAYEPPDLSEKERQLIGSKLAETLKTQAGATVTTWFKHGHVRVYLTGTDHYMVVTRKGFVDTSRAGWERDNDVERMLIDEGFRLYQQ